MKTTSILLLAVLGLSSCKWGTPEKQAPDAIFRDTVVYNYQAIHERAADCGSKPDSTCTVVDIKYPLFKGQAALNDSVKRGLLNINFSDSVDRDTSLKMMINRYFKDYADFKKYNKTGNMFFTMNTYAKVVNQDSSLLALEYGGYVYEGGAHGASFTEFINWNPTTKKPIYIKDILLPGTYPQFTKIAERIFRKDEKLTDTSSLARDYFFRDNKFWLNENYSITPAGIRFVYNQYEIKPYAAGQTELLLPYSEIIKLMRPQSVASQYIHKNAGI
jgi:hypothetical protein